jgi:hypothetical protein
MVLEGVINHPPLPCHNWSMQPFEFPFQLTPKALSINLAKAKSAQQARNSKKIQ